MAMCTWPGAVAAAAQESRCWGSMPPDLVCLLQQQHYSAGTACMRQVNRPQFIYTVRATKEHTAPPPRVVCCRKAVRTRGEQSLRSLGINKLAQYPICIVPAHSFSSSCRWCSGMAGADCP